MTASVHFATGAAAALLAQKLVPEKYDRNHDLGWRYLFGFLAGVVSHIIFDAIPHAEYSIGGEALLALLCVEAVLMMLFLIPEKEPVAAQLLVWGIIGAALPDILGMAGRKLGWEALTWPYEALHVAHGIAEPLFVGFWAQALIVVMCTFYVRLKSA